MKNFVVLDAREHKIDQHKNFGENKKTAPPTVLHVP